MRVRWLLKFSKPRAADLIDWMRLLKPSAGPLLMWWRNHVRILSSRFQIIFAAFFIDFNRQRDVHWYQRAKNFFVDPAFRYSQNQQNCSRIAQARDVFNSISFKRSNESHVSSSMYSRRKKTTKSTFRQKKKQALNTTSPVIDTGYDRHLDWLNRVC